MSYKSAVKVSRKKAILYIVWDVSATHDKREKDTLFIIPQKPAYTQSRRLDSRKRKLQENFRFKTSLNFINFFSDKAVFFFIWSFRD